MQNHNVALQMLKNLPSTWYR